MKQLSKPTVLGFLLVLIIAIAAPALASALAEEGAGDTVVQVLVAIVVILLAAKIGGDAASRVGQPAVLGELVVGVVLGNLALLGLNWFEPIKHYHTIEILAELGVILLLFEVGLESNLGEMMKVGVSSLLVAALGVIAPFFLGWGVGVWFYPDASVFVHVFLGATLTATSVGITARVLKDIHRIQSSESKIILGAAVIDDVMGLIILAVVAGIITAADGGAALTSMGIMWVVAKAVLFLGGAIFLSRLLYPHMFKVANYFRVHGMLLVMGLTTCFIMAVLAAKAGLAPIVGAFAAGLVLDEVYYRELPNLSKHHLEEALEPLIIFLVPIFFVHMGMLVDLTTFGQASVLGFALVLTVAAIVGKQLSSLGVVTKGANRWIVGLGMVPRGEVGLIFASIGLGLSIGGVAIISPEIYSAVVIMVIVTTMVTPPVLTWAFGKGGPPADTKPDVPAPPELEQAIQT
jgi:Kef-type K+ transport system membrane component KefB